MTVDPSAKITLEAHGSIAQIGQELWDSCACPEDSAGRPIDPFTTYRFLHALEASGSVGPNTGWEPHYLLARVDQEAIAVAPLYAKAHSQGEYIFDHDWAYSLQQAGGQYYPKLQIAVPFTPATGRRFLTRPGHELAGMSALVQGAIQLAADNELSGLHATFCTEAEAVAGEQMGLLRRTTQQYHWLNQGYADFDAFLQSLNSRKRKAIRKERATAQGFGGEINMFTGTDITKAHLEAFWDFYQDTGARKWGTPYLTRAFFDIAYDTLRPDMALVIASRQGRPIAGALNFVGRTTLYGRYWGCIEDHPCLHFEACYYQAIDLAIRMGLSRVEAGAQGNHKLARGYLPMPIHSLHWLAHPGFSKAVAHYLEEERAAVDEDIEILTSFGPFRKTSREEQQ